MKPEQLARPSNAQLAWHDDDMSMFLHIAPDVWRSRFFPKRFIPPSKINPYSLDAEQWVRAAESLGAKRLIFVAKHERGFCWWQTQTSKYGIKETPWKQGKGDVVSEISKACKTHGIKFGIYLSPQDQFFQAKVGGKCSTMEQQAYYNDVYRTQLIELLTRYGKIVEVWFDGSLVIPVKDIVTQYAPDAIIFQSPLASIRWVGNEAGFAPYPGWNSVFKQDAISGVATAAQGDPNGDMWLPLEVDTTMRNHYWFWEPKTEKKLKSLDNLMETYYRSVGHGAVLLINNSPDRTGLIPDCDMKRSAEFGAEIKRRFKIPLVQTSGEGETILIKCPSPIKIDHLILMEDISFGERVREYIIEGQVNDEWVQLVHGVCIGHKKIDYFKAQTVTVVRFRSLQSIGKPKLRSFALYYAGITPSFNLNNINVYNSLKVASWSNLPKKSWKAIEFDVSAHCQEATQYELQISLNKSSPNGSLIKIKSIVLLHEGVSLTEFTKEIENATRYELNITGFHQKHKIRIELQKIVDEIISGIITIRKK